MMLMQLIIVCQLIFTLACLIIQLYAICSQKWALFESRVELGLIEEHGHYGLWSICSRKLISAEVSESGGQLLKNLIDCKPVDTFYKPSHNRTMIAGFAIVHFLILLVYLALVTLRLLELYLYKIDKKLMTEMPNDNDLEEGFKNNKFRQHLESLGRSLFEQTGRPTLKHTKLLIRLKLCVISVAAAAATLAVWESIAQKRPLRDTDMFQIENVSMKNYRTFRGPGFFAQLMSLIIDMLLTSLIAIEVRVLVVLQQLEEDSDNEIMVVRNNITTNQETITSSYGTSDNIGSINSSFIINPFDPQADRRKIPNEPPGIPMRPTSSALNCSDQTSLYVNSLEVRRLKKSKTSNAEVEKKEQPQACTSKEVAYVNPTFLDEDHSIC